MPLFTQQPFVTRECFTAQHCFTDRDRLAQLFAHAASHCGTIPFIGERIIPLDKVDLITFRLPVLTSECLTKIMQYLRLGQPPFAPFLISHLWRLCLRIEPMQIRAALGIPILQGRMYPDLVQHLLYRISKRCRGLTLLCQFPQDLGAIFLQHSLWHLQQRHVDRLCCTSIDAAGKIVIHSCVIASRCFGIHALLLPELQLYWEVRNTHLRKGIIRQQDLTKKPELCLHLPNH